MIPDPSSYDGNLHGRLGANAKVPVTTAHVLERYGCPLHYWFSGPENAPVVVLCHSAGLDHRMFEDQVMYLGQTFRILTWDIRGHGLSKPTGKFTLFRAMKDLLAILDHHQIKECAFVGVSLGSYITQLIAYFYPERVTGMVLVSSTCITEKPSLYDRFWYLVSELMFTIIPIKWIATPMALRATYYYPIHPYVKPTLAQMSRRDYAAVWREIVHCYIDDPDYKVDKPLLLAYGEYDRFHTVKKAAKRWAKRNFNSYVKSIPGASHCPNMENTRYFNDIVEHFLFNLYPKSIPRERLRLLMWEI
jgi:pimeloyl-ACP methyl ester carboxylesterase